MAFVVDGAEWKFDGWTSAQVQEALEGFLELMNEASERGEKVWIGDDLQTRAVFGIQDLWSLRDGASGMQLDEGLWQELSAYLGRSQRYLDEPNWPLNLENCFLSIGNDPPTDNIDVAWAHHNVRSGKAVACVGLKRRGRFTTNSSQGPAEVHWIFNPLSTSQFWREAMIVEGNSQAVFERLAHRAYPNLHFHGKVLENAGVFTGGFHANAGEIKRYLAGLNDFGRWVFSAPPPAETPTEVSCISKDSPSNQLIQKRFELLGLVIAPEKPNVYRDSHCRTARQIELNERILYCEWHCKLQAHQNRIHIHAPVGESNDKVVIAILASHLPLP